jgi:hypothetical protein
MSCKERNFLQSTDRKTRVKLSFSYRYLIENDEFVLVSSLET